MTYKHTKTMITTDNIFSGREFRVPRVVLTLSINFRGISRQLILFSLRTALWLRSYPSWLMVANTDYCSYGTGCQISEHILQHKSNLARECSATGAGMGKTSLVLRRLLAASWQLGFRSDAETNIDRRRQRPTLHCRETANH